MIKVYLLVQRYIYIYYCKGLYQLFYESKITTPRFETVIIHKCCRCSIHLRAIEVCISMYRIHYNLIPIVYIAKI